MFTPWLCSLRNGPAGECGRGLRTASEGREPAVCIVPQLGFLPVTSDPVTRGLSAGLTHIHKNTDESQLSSPAFSLCYVVTIFHKGCALMDIGMWWAPEGYL